MRRLIQSVLVLLCLSGCSSLANRPTPIELPILATPANSLSEIPVFVGEMTLNEGNNGGFSDQYVVSWASDDLKITTKGKVTGSFKISCNGPLAPYPNFKDVLFFQVQGRYIWPAYGDIQNVPISDVLPLVAQSSDERSATFQVLSSFQIPPLMDTIDGGLPLKTVELTLTWVRVYKSDQGFYFQVFAGFPSRYSKTPEIRFDQKPQPLTARFDYYSWLPESGLKGGRAVNSNSRDEFEYHTWIRENLKW